MDIVTERQSSLSTSTGTPTTRSGTATPIVPMTIGGMLAIGRSRNSTFSPHLTWGVF